MKPARRPLWSAGLWDGPAPSLEVTVTLVAALAPTGLEIELGLRRHWP